MAKKSISLEEYKRVFREVYIEKEKQGFEYHAISYITVNIFLILFNLYFTPQYIWFYYPLIFWGIGLIFHYIGVARAINSVIELERKAEEKLKGK
ncbi:MAG: 2TM domain-containing protein [Candidatus Aenigmatarchaeota archaeon]